MRSEARSRIDSGRAGTIIELVVVVLVVMGLVGVLMPSLCKSRETANRVKCAANLKQIGNGLLLYANENRGQFPRTHYVMGAPVVTTNDGAADVDPFKVAPIGGRINNIPAAMFLLIRQEDLTPAVFVCPSGTAEADSMNGLPATSRSNFTGDEKGGVAKMVSYSFVNVYPAEAAMKLKYKEFITAYSSDFATAADISPLELGAPRWSDLKVGVSRSTVILGNSKNHDSDGQNVLYADGHADFQQTPLCGANNDNIYTAAAGTDADGVSAKGVDPDPRSATDSVLLINIIGK